MKEFMYCFQISKLITFEVNFYTLGTNSAPHFSTSANEFCRSKLDYTRGGQAQRDLLPKFSPARRFFEKWDHCHLHDLTPAEYEEIAADIEELKHDTIILRTSATLSAVPAPLFHFMIL